jgi:hypothetical protein
MEDIHALKKHLILVSGFGWSGSGAVVDFLLNNSHIDTACNDEIIFFWVLNRLIDKVGKRKQIIQEGEYESLFCAIIPQSYSTIKKTQYQKTFNKYFERLNIKQSEYTEFAKTIIHRLQKLSKRSLFSRIDESAIGVIISDYLVFLNSMIQLSEKLSIYDNLLHPQQLMMLVNADLSFFTSIKIFCVDRDPRDQFFDHYKRYETGLGLWHTMNTRQKILTKIVTNKLVRWMLKTTLVKLLAALVFVIMHKKKRRKFEQVLASIPDTQHELAIIEVNFEDLVYNNCSKQEQIRTSMDEVLTKYFKETQWGGNKYFDSNSSMKNIGKFRSDKHQIVYKLIAQMLHNYIRKSHKNENH